MQRINADTYVGAHGAGFDLSPGATMGVSLLGDHAPPLRITVQPRGEEGAVEQGLHPVISCALTDGSVSADGLFVDAEDEKSYTIVRPAAKAVHVVRASGRLRPRADWLIVNPASGFKRGREWVDELVLPLLEMVGVTATVHETAAEGDGEPIARRIVEAAASPPTLIVCGGDGTTAEVINGIGERAATLVILPVGTANAFNAAMYVHAEPVSEQMRPLRSLVAFVRGQSEPAPLPLARVSWSPSESALVHVVGSFALHASILYDAAHDPVPGLERFKRAAAANIGRQYEGTLALTQARAYDRAKGEFSDRAEDVNLDGPFSYIASALVDRFEATFVVCTERKPLLADGTIDVVVIKHQSPETLMRITGAMYDGGKHIADELVEYYRCSRIVWKPSADFKSRLVCADGAVHEIAEGGQATTEPLSQSKIRVWR